MLHTENEFVDVERNTCEIVFMNCMIIDKRIWKQEAIQNFPKPTAEQKIKP